MARAYRRVTRKKGRRVGSMKSRTKTQTRRAGAFGLYRSTRFSTLRAVSRKIGYARSLSPFPDNKMVKHRYCDVITMSAAGGAGLPSVYQFRANSTYDPDYSGVGHQPMFRDEMANQYKKYTVVKSYIKITVPPEETTPRTFFLWCDSDTTAPASRNDLQEQHKGLVAVKLDKRNTPLVLKGWFDGPKWFKSTPVAFVGDPDHRTDAGTNPAAVTATYFNLFSYPTNDSTTLAALKVHVEMVFYCIWREPYDHAGS